MLAPTLPTLPAWLARLNPAQHEAVAHGGEPLLIVAGAGTGKTATLAARAARLLQDGVDPQRLLLLTFSRRAADELAQRAGRCLQQALGLPATTPAPALPWAGTFHAVGARLLRRWAGALGLPAGFGVIDRGDAEDLLALEREALGLAAQRRRFPLKGSCLAIYSRVVNTGAPLAQVLAAAYPWCARWEPELKALFAAYDAAKRRQALLDLDDLLAVWAEALADDDIARVMGACFDHVLVDEAQDSNRLQLQILLRLKPDGRGLTLVGDDAQSIYGFRGAEPRNLLDFPRRCGAATRVIRLEQNYRSTPALLAASNALIAEAPERLAKTLWSALPEACRPALVSVADEAAQAAWVGDEVLRQHEAGVPLRAQAVLFRSASHSLALELELARRGIPFVKYGGLQFMQAAHVKDLLALLRWAHNPRHTLAAFRCATKVPGIGPARARRVVDAMAAAADPASVLTSLRAPPAAAADWARLAATWQALRDARARWPEVLATALDWLLPLLPRHYADAEPRAADLRQLQRVAGRWPSCERFLTELTLDPPQASSDLAGPPYRDDDWLVLSTIHAAKGQEWSAVTVLNLVDGCLPADLATGNADEVEEERRVLYVAMTRARHRLHLMLPQRFHVTGQPAYGDRHVHALPSRFLSPAVVAACDRMDPEPAPDPSSSAPRHESLAVTDGEPGQRRGPAADQHPDPAVGRPEPAWSGRIAERMAGRWS